MSQPKEQTNSPIRSDVWNDPEAQHTIAIHAGTRVAAYFNDCGEVVVIQEGAHGFDDDHLSFNHKHLPLLIARLQAMAAENPEDYYSDGYREALKACGES